jgi:recombinational DNA repair protein RecR
MLKKQMHPCYKCEHLSSDERCKISRVLECYYNPTEFGHQVAPLHERPPLRMFKQRTEQPIFVDELFRKLKDEASCVSCGAITAGDVIICPTCAARRSSA